MGNEDFLSWLYVGGGLELYQELLQKELKLDVVVFPTFGETPEPMGWFPKPIKSVAELKGLKFRATGLSAEVFKEMGMNVVSLAPGEIVPALERGVIDAAEFSDPSSDLALGFPNVRKFYHMPGIHQPTGMMEFYKHGVTIVETSKEIQLEILKAWDRVAERKAKENAFFAKVLESQRAFAKRVVPYRRCCHPAYELSADHYWGGANTYKIRKP
jgi:TRAP-type mannitol/chloroaromatic compound transport system substrate-binding protein